MRKSILALIVIMALLSPAPAQAFSLKTPFVKTGHALKVVGKKVGQGAEWAWVHFMALAFCASTGQCE